MSLRAKLRERARSLKRESYALYLAYRDPRVSWAARLFIAAIAAYLLSPIDLVPDFIPVLGYLDDLILVPLAITLALKMIPAEVLAECRQRADERMSLPRSRSAAVVIVLVWAVLVLLAAVWGIRLFQGGR